MKKVFILAMFLIASQLSAAPTLVEINFTSLGAGINQKLYQQVSAILEIEKKYENIVSIEVHKWGREGEKTVCASFSQLDHMQRVKSILDVLADDLTSVQFAHHCRANEKPVFSCTADLNPWNKPSQCECPEYQTYQPRLGQCVNKYLSGVLHEAAAINGESAPFLLVSYDGKTKTEVSFVEHLQADARRFAERGFPAGISGTYKTIYSTERKPWVLFHADELYIEE